MSLLQGLQRQRPHILCHGALERPIIQQGSHTIEQLLHVVSLEHAAGKHELPRKGKSLALDFGDIKPFRISSDCNVTLGFGLV